jgi:SAM-dependent methyltransferase
MRLFIWKSRKDEPWQHGSNGERILDGEYSFTRYLAAKKSVDDRALNSRVWQTLARSLPVSKSGEPLRVLEIGAGIGTMLERALSWGLLAQADYTAIDQDGGNLAHAQARLPRWGKAQGYRVSVLLDSLRFEKGNQIVTARLLQADLFDFLKRQASRGPQTWDLLIAHAFLDLVDLPTTLAPLLELLVPGGLFYFTLCFDGATLLEPAIDSSFDEQVQRLYHQTMDQRFVAGRPSGDSRTGRHLFAYLNAVSAEILAAGSSDWVVYPGGNSYPEDEAYFLHFIINTLYQALLGHPDLDPDRFERWVAARHAQVERGEMVYIAHQLDFVGKRA